MAVLALAALALAAPDTGSHGAPAAMAAAVQATPIQAPGAASMPVAAQAGGAPGASAVTPSSRTSAPTSPPQEAAEALPEAQPLPPHTRGCLREGNGYFRARIQGALDRDIDWHDADIVCEADVQPGSSIRLAFLGPPGKEQLRVILGIHGVHEGERAHARPTNLTLILPGGRLYATAGDERCTVDELVPRRLAGGGRSRRRYRVEGRGFCVEPVNGLSGSGHLIISRFDFAGGIVYTSP